MKLKLPALLATATAITATVWWFFRNKTRQEEDQDGTRETENRQETGNNSADVTNQTCNVDQNRADNQYALSIDRNLSYVSNWIPSVVNYIPSAFKINECIGEGASGSVHIGIDDNDNKFALKLTKRFLFKGVDLNKRSLEREMALHHQGSTHENVSNVYGMYLDEHKNKLVLVTEYINGNNIYEILLHLGDCFTERRARSYVKKIASALNHIHNSGIIHRDLNLGNVMICNNNRIENDGSSSSSSSNSNAHMDERLKLIDFGDAIAVDKAGNDTERSRGSPGFQAPEYINGDAFDTKADMFSLGVMLYLMVYGHFPFDYGEDEYDTGVRDGSFDLEFDEDVVVSDEAKEVIKGLLCENQHTRLSAAGVLSHQWMANCNNAE